MHLIKSLIIANYHWFHLQDHNSVIWLPQEYFSGYATVIYPTPPPQAGYDMRLIILKAKYCRVEFRIYFSLDRLTCQVLDLANNGPDQASYLPIA